ncbi:MAG: DUF1772 domain-containing protein [Ilumatobacter sp.]|nr:DUF1772 domain-containing protein [Ilumatobacter sp.]
MTSSITVPPATLSRTSQPGAPEPGMRDTTAVVAPTAEESPPWFAALQRSSLILATVLVGLAAGFFFTYQISVTRALAEVDDTTYVDTFQAINSTIRNTPFGLVFFGAIPALCAALALHRGDRHRRLAIGIALVLYVATFAITAAGSVPLNDTLGLVTDRSTDAVAQARADFEQPWNRLNLIRTLTSLGALVAMSVATLGRSRDNVVPGTTLSQ